MDGLNSNLDLNGRALPGVVPGLGEWGPTGVPSTRAKKRARFVVVAVLLAATTAVTLFGWWIWTLLR